MTMGDKIKYYREEKGWSQEELGAKLPHPVQKAAVMKWEKGNVENIKRSNILKMAELFEISPCELMFSEDVPKPKDEPVPLLTPEQTELIQLFSTLNTDGKKAVLSYVTYVASQSEYQNKKKELLNA